jgi:copper(I)-binding protein
VTAAPPGRARNWLREAAQAAAAPAACAAVFIGLLSAWVATGGAGTITPVRIQVSLAAIPMRGFAPAAAAAVRTVGIYLTIRDLAGLPDQLIAARSPAARRVVLLHRASPADPGVVVAALGIPADASISLSPFGDDVVLIDPVAYEADGSVPLTLVFRHAGQVTIDAAVTAPGTP